MPFPNKSVPVRGCLFLSTCICSLFILTYGTSSVIAKANDEVQTINIGAVVHVDTRVGREQKTAMDIAVEDLNANSANYKLSIHYRNGSREPLQSAFAAEELIQDKKARVIVGTGEWQEAALLADVGNRLQVATISLVAPDISPPFASLRWPYLIQMGRNGSEQIQCIADLVSMYQWRRVVVIYENEAYGGDSGSFALLANALLVAGSQIEYELSLPPLASLSNPKEAIRQEVSKLVDEGCISRVFIVLHLSQTLATHLFVEAKEKGLTGKESVWLITESIVDYFPSLDAHTLSSMEGALGVKTDNPISSEAFEYFKARFWTNFFKEYPEEQDSEPGFHALQAYDAITAIGKATNTSRVLPEYIILLVNFTGLSGQIYYKEGKLAPQKRSYRLVNVVGKQLVHVDLWTPGIGFSENQASSRAADGSFVAESLAGNVIWPAGLNTTSPKGWVNSTDNDVMKIVIPDSHAFKSFVEIQDNGVPSGFCIDLFNEVVNILGYNFSIEFHPSNSSYEELVDSVYNKTYAAAVGDFTTLANRTDYIEFTQPFAESGLAMLLPIKPDSKNKGWIFVRPFKRDLWIATLGILIYTMLTVWFLEHRHNPEFRGPWKDQLSTAVWFTFSSLFFAQREGIRSSYTRVVLVVWFFVVLILTQSYTADLSSMLTVARLNQNDIDIETLVTRNAKVGCRFQSFTKDFLVNVLKFNSVNILDIETDIKYFHGNFTEGKMKAAFLEIPYARLFQNKYCDDYTMTVTNYRFGGLSFVFPKGSPLAVDVSRAILNLTENGVLKQLEKTYLNAKSKCSSTDQSDGSSNNDTENLTLKSFWGLFVLSGVTSTLCFLGAFIPVIRQYRRYLRDSQSGDGNVARLSFASYIVNGGSQSRNLNKNVRNNNGSFSMRSQSLSSWVVV